MSNPSHSPPSRRFISALAAIGAVGLAIRVWYVTGNHNNRRLWGDSFYYFTQAQELNNGNGFIAVLQSVKYGTTVPSAEHPPGFTLVLAGLQRLGLTTPDGERYALAVLGTVTIVLVGLLARRVMGSRAGLIAAGITAIYPQIWINDAVLMSETLFVFGFTLAMLEVYAYYQEPRLFRLGVASLGLTIAASARPESILLFALVLVPLVIARREHEWRVRVGHLAVAALFPLLAFVPWTVYNANRFSKPVLMSTGFGQTLLAANCGTTYYGKYLGSYSLHCLRGWVPPAPPPGEPPDQSVNDAYYRDKAVLYMKGHAARLPIVMVAREGRMWGIYRPSQQNAFDRYAEGRGSIRLVTWAQRSYWLLAILALFGVALWRRWKIPLYPLMAQVGLITFVAAITFGNTRYRAGAEIAIVLWATATLEWLIIRWRSRADQPDPEPVPALGEAD